MQINLQAVQSNFDNAVRGDSRAIELIVNWSLMVISGDINNSSCDATSDIFVKEYSEVAYALNVALYTLGKTYKSVMKEYMLSAISADSNTDVWSVSIPMMDVFTVKQSLLVGVLYKEIFKTLNRIMKDER